MVCPKMASWVVVQIGLARPVTFLVARDVAERALHAKSEIFEFMTAPGL